MRFLLIAIVTAATALVGAAYWASLLYFRAEERERAEARLTLYQSTVEAELQRFAHMPYILSRDPFVIATAKGSATAALNARLRAFAQQAGLDAIYLMTALGDTIAASNFDTDSSFVGQNYAFRPYFRQALEGRQGAFYGIGATTGIPGYFYAEAVRAEAGDVLGVMAIKIDLSELQASWQRARERVLLTNADGVVLLASQPEWRYRTLGALSPAQRAQIAQDRQFGTEPLRALDWQAAQSGWVALESARFMHLEATGLPNGWALHYLTTDDAARNRALLVTGALVLLVGLGVIYLQVLRTRRIGSALRRSVDEEAALRLANDRLAVEIAERRDAESRLQKTQGELERAGRLAALGQLASSVTHELGQPIAAMRNQIAAAEMRGSAPELTQRMHALVERMEGITRQLKFFSRKGRDQMETVDLAQAVQAALELVSPGLDSAGVQLRWTAPDHPVNLHANRLRIEQVATNLIRNALDAVLGAEAPWIALEVGADDMSVWFEVSDNGHGLGDKSFAELREPFATTRESGVGMGLGLTISAGIVDDHNGTLSAENRPGGGAVFRAVFRAHGPKPKEPEAS